MDAGVGLRPDGLTAWLRPHALTARQDCSTPVSRFMSLLSPCQVPGSGPARSPPPPLWALHPAPPPSPPPTHFGSKLVFLILFQFFFSFSFFLLFFLQLNRGEPTNRLKLSQHPPWAAPQSQGGGVSFGKDRLTPTGDITAVPGGCTLPSPGTDQDPPTPAASSHPKTTK